MQVDEMKKPVDDGPDPNPGRAVTEWVHATLQYREARFHTNEAGFTVEADFEFSGMLEFLAPLVIPTLMKNETLRAGLVAHLRAAMEDPATAVPAMETTADLFDVLTTEQFNELVRRRGILP
jgi:hypothetical protein